MSAIGSSMSMSQFMDKQIMDLSNSHRSSGAIDLMDPQEFPLGSAKKEEIEPSYDFELIRPIGTQSNPDLDSCGGGARVWNSADSKTTATAGIGIRNYSSLDSTEPAKFIAEKDHHGYNAALASEIDRTMKKHMDSLLHALEGLSARLSQLESRARHLENSVDDLKLSIGNNHGSTDGKLRELENVLREVQASVQDIRDKQDVRDAQLQLAKLPMLKAEQHPESQNAESVLPAVSAPQLSHPQLAPAGIVQPPSALPPPSASVPPASPQNLPPPAQLPGQFPPGLIASVPQREPFFHPPGQGQTQEATNPQYQLPPPQQLQPPLPAPPQQQYQPPPLPPYSQLPPPTQQHPPISLVNPPQPQPQPQPPLGHHPEEAPYGAPQNYPPSLRQPPHPPSGTPSQQFYGAPSHMYEPSSSRPGSGFSTAYGPSLGSTETYPYSGSPSQYGGSFLKQLSSAPASGGGSGYPQLPTARILPQALPSASGVGGGSGLAGTGNRVPVDDVVDKVTSMGFPRDQVRATVRKLTENGQSVDLNAVLDKLMNDGEGHPPRGWFGQ